MILKKIFLSLLFFLLCLTPFYGVSLLDLFQKAIPGNFVVFDGQKQFTLFRIYQKGEDTITIEEITAPNQKNLLEHPNWQSWIDNFAPGHTSWTLTTFGLHDGKLLSIYSFSTNEWIEKDTAFAFLPTLFSLELESVPRDARKRIGPPPEASEIDRRKLWTPKIIFNGKAEVVPCAVFSTRWPHDTTELSGTLLYLYFPEKKGLVYFPYWIEIVGKISKVKLRVIDSGESLTSPAILPSITKSEQDL